MIRQRHPLARGAPPARTGKPKTVNRARKAREYARTNHSAERDAFVRSLPCCACGIEYSSEVAHVGNEGAGAGRKANYDQTAPLCGPRERLSVIVEGCHRESHRGQASFEAKHRVDLAAEAAATEAAWQAFQAGASC
jgi:hypothetical protein